MNDETSLNDDDKHEKGESNNQKLMMDLLNYKKYHNESNGGWYDVTITKNLKHLVTDYIIKSKAPEVCHKLNPN